MIDGFVEPEFEQVKAAFIENFKKGKEIGASLCIYLQNKKIVDLWGGYRNIEQSQLWQEDTIVPVFSTTKGVCALVLALAHSRGWFDYDEKVSSYWSEFAQHGKESITVRQLFSHQAGLPAINKPLTNEMISDIKLLSSILAAQKPAWNPGAHHGYHVWSFGFYVSAFIYQIDPQKRTLGQFLQEELVKPLEAQFYIGLPDYIPDVRLATLYPPNMMKAFLGTGNPIKGVFRYLLPNSIYHQAMANPSVMKKHTNLNRREVLALEIGSGNGVGEARGLARLYSEFAIGGKNLGITEKTLEVLHESPKLPVKGSKDWIWDYDTNFSVGFIKPYNKIPYGGHPHAFGHHGAGGSSGYADPYYGIGYGYVVNRMDSHHFIDPRDQAIRDALYKCLQ